jgi:transcription termination factor Rho
MSVLDRSALVDSPLADLHAIASELSIDGYRRLRRDELVDAIVVKQGGDVSVEGTDQPEEESSGGTRRRSSRRGGGRSTADAEGDAEQTPEPSAEADDAEQAEAAPKPRRSRSRSRKPAGDDAPKADGDDSAKADAGDAPKAEAGDAPRGDADDTRRADADDAPVADADDTPKFDADDAADAPQADEAPEPTAGEDRPSRSRRGGRARPSEERTESAPSATEDEIVEGTVEVLPNGSGFVRVAVGEASDGDVYISSAQVKRCELVSGDTVTGPKRAPRRSERFASLIRIETINGRPASEQADVVRFDDLPSTLPTKLIELSGADPTLKPIQTVTPFGRGSRVTIVGAARAGKTEALRAIAAALAGQEDLTVSVALAGVRPEEIGAWSADGDTALPVPAGAVSFAASEDARAGVLEPVIDQARRLAARGSHAVVLIDTLDGLSAHAARKLMASARNITDGGSVAIIATASAPVGGETTVIALDLATANAGRFLAIDLLASGTLRPELLVGDAGAKKITREHTKALKD